MAAMVGVLAALTLARSAIFALRGADNVYSGLFSQVYYAYASLAAVLLAMSMLWLVFERLAGQLATLATRDALTRVLNRSGLDDALARHFGRRQAPPVTLLSLDIDHFKRINDNHGHATGDAVLRDVADALRRNVRPGDLVARMGGEEFCVCCPDCPAADAGALAERLRLAVATLATPAGDAAAPIGCTISIGISRPCGTLADWQHTAAAADAALYAAKAGGRNRVVMT
jgi:diguanylate cyclase (GGDEF)-like protein